MAEIARALATANGYGDRVTIVSGHSRHVSLPERARVVVSDQIGHLGWEAGVLEYFRDAARRFLVPGGQLIPRSIRLWLAPVEARTLWQHVSFWSTQPAGFDMSPAQQIAWNSGHTWRVEPSESSVCRPDGCHPRPGERQPSFHCHCNAPHRAARDAARNRRLVLGRAFGRSLDDERSGRPVPD